jgi:hypothetical protein
MRTRILAEAEPVVVTWLTTADVARLLDLSTNGVRWLAQEQRLASTVTASGQRLFRLSDVQRYAEARLLARLRAKRPRPTPKRCAEPRQLSLSFESDLRLVLVGRGRQAKVSLEDPTVKAPGFFNKWVKVR